jgi:hypothetical protein
VPDPLPSAAPAKAPSRRLAFLRRTLPLLLLLAGALWYFRGAPRDVTLAMDLAGRRDGLRSLSVDLYQLPERTRARHVEFFYSQDNPPAPQLRTAVRIPPADYQAVVAFHYGDKTETLERRFTLESQDEVVLPP